MAYDWDAEQAHEADQQRAVEAVASIVNRTSDSVGSRSGIVAAMLDQVHGGAEAADDLMRSRTHEALAPVRAFTDDEVERRLLTMRACAKLFGGLLAITEGAWLRASLERRDGADAPQDGPRAP